MVFHKDLEANQYVVPGSGYHMRMSARARLKSLFDNGEFETLTTPEVPLDPLKFRDERKYSDRLKDARKKTELTDAVLVAEGKLGGLPLLMAVQDFSFMGGSLGMAAGEAIIAGMEKALEKQTPFIIFVASGGARMQEGILSLMQMPRTTVAVQRLREARLPYIVVFTHPTTGGVTASYAMLGDIHIAEPGALIGFAGPRVIEQTIREQLPEGFQRSNYLLEHGMIDLIVNRHDMRDTLIRICHILVQDPLAFNKKESTNIATDESIEPPADELGDSAGTEPVEIKFVSDENVEIILPEAAESDAPRPPRKRKKKRASQRDDSTA